MPWRTVRMSGHRGNIARFNPPVPAPIMFDFDPSLVTFTPGMAKRATSVFAAAPIIQGKRDATGMGDYFFNSRGSLVAGTAFYANLDTNQGTICFRITPEWNGNDGLASALFTSSSFLLDKTSGGGLRVQIYDGTNWHSFGINILGWVAGTTYNVCFRWDIKNTLDGTNHICLSVNDVHGFGDAIAYSGASVPNSESWIGMYSWGSLNCNAIIEGLTIYRRVLYDGTYGVDVGNGDEVALIAAGVDPCTITGSWDVCFCLPTNATPGALVTGTGEAWSHPHSSNLLTPINGFMADTAWNNWTMEGSPINSAVLATAEKIYAWGYKYESDAVDEGYKYTLAGLTPGADYVIRAIAHAVSGNAQPKLIVYDETNAAILKTVTGTVAPTKTVPDMLMCSFELPTIARGAAADCVSISIKVLNAANVGVVGWHQVELLPNLLDNPSFDTGAAANPWIPDGWTNNGLDAGDTEKETVITHSGGASLQGNASYDDTEFISRAIAAALGKYVCFGGWGYERNIYLTWMHEYDYSPQYSNVSPFGLALPAGASWRHTLGVARVKTANASVESWGSANVLYIDDFYAVLLDDVSLSVTPASAANSVESGGIRVDGWDIVPQVIPAGRLFASTGWTRIRYLPRHSGADALKFGSATPYIADWYGDANNYFYIYWSAASTITLAFKSAGGVLQTGNWATAGAILAGGNYLLEVKYDAGNMYLYVDGVLRITVTSPIAFTTIPVFCYPATANTVVAGQHEDSVFLTP